MFNFAKLHGSILKAYFLKIMAKRSREAKRELKQSQFWAMPLNRKWPFISFLDDGFAEIFSQIISIRVKKRSNTNFISSTYIETENASLPVDVHHSKTLLLKLPIIRRRALIKFSFQRSVTVLICLWKKYLVIEGAMGPFEYLTHGCISMHVYKI